ncbi:hypothetical protein HY624_02540 [Candidatus Uhrbacteria bacterium]|nr:hypothetical protein [Candidatus Uhrbacteria bacterium]
MVTDRQRAILFALVEEYTRHAVPVASKTLVRGTRFTVSPATMRNEFAALERAGFIAKQHTSAGRVPTDAGYRLYVNQCLEKPAINDGRERQARHAFERVLELQHSFERELAKAIAELAGEVAIVASGEGEIFYSGMSHLFEKPEFDTRLGAQEISRAMDNFDALMPELLEQFDGVDRPAVLIGKETPMAGDCSIVLMRHNFDDTTTQGLLAIIGPMRMQYRSNIDILKTAAHVLENYGSKRRSTKRIT